MGPEMCKNHCPLCRRLGCKRFVQSETCKQSRSGSLWWIKKPKRFDIFRKTVAICVSMYLSPYLSNNQRFNQPINESIHPFIHPPIYIYIYIYLFFDFVYLYIFFVRKQAGHLILNIYVYVISDLKGMRYAFIWFYLMPEVRGGLRWQVWWQVRRRWQLDMAMWVAVSVAMQS